MYVFNTITCVLDVSNTITCVLDVSVPHLDRMHLDGNYDISHLLAEEFGAIRKTPYTGIPTPPDRGPFIAEVTGHYLTLSWIPTRRAPPRYPQVSYVVEIRELPDKDWVLVSGNHMEAKPRKAKCVLENLAVGTRYTWEAFLKYRKIW